MENFGCKKEFPLLGAVEIREEWVEVPISRYEELIRRETELNILTAVYNNGEGRYRVDDVFDAIKRIREPKMQGSAQDVEMKTEGAEEDAEQSHHHGASDTRPGTSSDR